MPDGFTGTTTTRDVVRRDRYNKLSQRDLLLLTGEQIERYLESGKLPDGFNGDVNAQEEVSKDLKQFIGSSGEMDEKITLYERQTILHIINKSELLSEPFKKVLGYKLSCLWEGTVNENVK